jgi:hypothetical protein
MPGMTNYEQTKYEQSVTVASVKRHGARSIAVVGLILGLAGAVASATPAAAATRTCASKKYVASTHCVVPAGATSVFVEAAGAAGGSGGSAADEGGAGGSGSIWTSIYSVSPGQKLSIVVGARGGDGNSNPGTPGAGGATTGAAGGAGEGPNPNLGGGGGGGGFSGVIDLSTSIVLNIAGGGGGGGGGGNSQQGNSNDNGGVGGSNGGNGGNGEGTGGQAGVGTTEGGEAGGGNIADEAGGGGGGGGCQGGGGGSAGNGADQNGSGAGGGAGSSCSGMTNVGGNDRAGYVVIAFNPTITSFTPKKGSPGTKVTISGKNLSGAEVAFDGTTAKVTKDTVTSITATVPSAANSGKITVTTAGGTATSAKSFTVT